MRPLDLVLGDTPERILEAKTRGPFSATPEDERLMLDILDRGDPDGSVWTLR